jgi:hypothetical protein
MKKLIFIVFDVVARHGAEAEGSQETGHLNGVRSTQAIPERLGVSSQKHASAFWLPL